MTTDTYRWRDSERLYNINEDVSEVRMNDSNDNNYSSPTNKFGTKEVENSSKKINKKKQRTSQCTVKFTFAREVMTLFVLLAVLTTGYFYSSKIGKNQEIYAVQSKSSLFEQRTNGNVIRDDIAKEFEYIDTLAADLVEDLESTGAEIKNKQNSSSEENFFDASFRTREEMDFIETVVVPFNSLRYRRVCTSVGRHSVLCMTIRFPFEFPAPVTDPTIKIPVQPIVEDFYNLDIKNMYIIMPNDWLRCNNNSMILDSVDDITIKSCLYSKAELISQQRADRKEPVTVLWTRTKHDNDGEGTTILHSVGTDDSVSRIYDYFGNDHEIVVLGASPAPQITESLHNLLGTHCVPTYVNKKPNYNCVNPKVASGHASRQLSRKVTNDYNRTFSTLQESRVNIGVIDYRSIAPNGIHELPLTVLETLQVLERAPGWTELRNLTVIMEYPFAHIQTETMIEKFPGKINELQTNLPSFVMDVQSVEGRLQLTKQGFKLSNIIVFDGLPQFYPTRTSGWSPSMMRLEEKNGKITHTGNWKPEYGTNCVGPLPRHSVLRGVNDLSRRSFEQLHFDDRWYGRTWEFVNLFWWQMARYSWMKNGLDCTHNDASDGVNGVHRFFVQAMVDEFLEDR